MSTPGPHWIKVRPQSAVRLYPTPELAGTVPVFQADPTAPSRSVRILRHAQAFDIQNFHDRAVAVGVFFVDPSTIDNIALFTRALKEGKDP